MREDGGREAADVGEAGRGLVASAVVAMAVGEVVRETPVRQPVGGGEVVRLSRVEGVVDGVVRDGRWRERRVGVVWVRRRGRPVGGRGRGGVGGGRGVRLVVVAEVDGLWLGGQLVDLVGEGRLEGDGGGSGVGVRLGVVGVRVVGIRMDWVVGNWVRERGVVGKQGLGMMGEGRGMMWNQWLGMVRERGRMMG